MKRLLLLLALAFPALAARTTVADTLTRADGSTCSGTLSVSWPSFTNGDGFFFAGTTTSTINPATGAFSISLEPGPYYTVTYVVAPSGCSPTTERADFRYSSAIVFRAQRGPAAAITQHDSAFLHHAERGDYGAVRDMERYELGCG